MKTINLSLKHGKFPDLCKKSIVKPSVKDSKECTDTLKNYRPVSNLSFISKLIEKAVLNQLTKHLTENNLFCSRQSGYRRFHSCETLNVKMFNDILKEMDEGCTVALLLLDMSAAFDTIDHSLLLSLLSDSYGIDGNVLEWFRSYLCHRSCSVNINNTFSDFICLLFGVPQGSILGPILFILYTKHVQHIASKYGLYIQLYADDTQLYIGFNSKSTTSVETAKINIECCIKEIKVWMCTRYLKLNEDETKLLFFAKPSFGVQNSFSIDVGSDEIVCTDWKRNADVKSLGVYLDPSCKFDTQIAEVRKFCFGQLMSWKGIAPFLTIDVKLMLVKQIILSKLDYNNCLYSGLTNVQIQKLQSIINSSIRFVYNLGYRDSVTHYIIRSHILPVRYRIDFKVCLLVFNCLHDLAPEYLQDLITWNVPSRTVNSNIVSSLYIFTNNNTAPRKTQDPYLLVIPTDFGNRTMYRSRSFSHYAPRIWNKIPFNIRCLTSKDSFKSELKTFLFDKFLSDNYLV